MRYSILYLNVFSIKEFMASKDNKLKSNVGSASSRSGKLGKNRDVDSQLLKQLSSKMGNQGLNARLQKSSAERDLLLQFICNQLKNVQQIQQIELDEVRKRDEWFREVAKGEQNFKLPDPERWKECASLYKKSSQALCRGDVSRGKKLLEEALKKEDAARQDLPEQVEERLDAKDKVMTASPVSTASEDGEICPATRAPKDLDLADKILSVRSTVRNASPVRRTPAFNWWEQIEESEEEVEIDQETQTREDKEAAEEDTGTEREYSEKDSHNHAPHKSDE